MAFNRSSQRQNVARHLPPLAALISGIVGRQSPPLPPIATQGPEDPKPESRVKRFARWLDNAPMLAEASVLPSADLVLRHCACQTLGLVMDGRGVGRDGAARRLHVLEKGRALPLAWRVRPGPKGPCPADRHLAVVALMRAVLPEGATGGCLGEARATGRRCRPR
jgi:hypothetical protein